MRNATSYQAEPSPEDIAAGDIKISAFQKQMAGISVIVIAFNMCKDHIEPSQTLWMGR